MFEESDSAFVLFLIGGLILGIITMALMQMTETPDNRTPEQISLDALSEKEHSLLRREY